MPESTENERLIAALNNVATLGFPIRELKTSLLLILILSFAASAQPPTFFPQTHPTRAEGTTYGDVNGRGWNVLSKDAKSFFLIGLAEGIVRESDVFEKKYKAGTLSVDEVRTAIDRFFTEPENLLVPVIDAVHIVAMKTNGALQAEIDIQLSAIRAVSAKWHEDHKP